MKFLFRRTWVAYFFALALVAAIVLAANVASSATGNGTPAGKDLNELQPIPNSGPVAGQNVAKPLTYPSETPGTGPAHGIVNNSQTPFPADEYVIQNQWQDLIGGQWVQVYAGSLYEDSSQGVVIVRISPADWSNSTIAGEYRVKGGSLRIVSASGSILVLQNPAGLHLKFDAGARKFL
jgi:hypothetical protein